MSDTDSTALGLAHLIVGALENKKAEDILLLDLVGVCSFADYFVLCTGGSERTLKALADEAQGVVKRQTRKSTRGLEGHPSSGWVLLDFGDVIVHIFSPAMRAYYQLEDLWREGQVLFQMR